MDATGQESQEKVSKKKKKKVGQERQKKSGKMATKSIQSPILTTILFLKLSLFDCDREAASIDSHWNSQTLFRNSAKAGRRKIDRIWSGKVRKFPE